uniref:ATPEG8 n=1 Tax=Euglena gracilis TaxID=3039 RepID=UPI0012B67D78|nr:Chain T, ATPEG8 [Euglena gracilis]6TDU_t Chain t, ATPEG8 [Euglena gracilis]6TDV_T Chain T, ATPEG8 [Euglena gracilis]6TDV_t Chain t, ATPEG8 [Euglena gracilis]
MGGKASEAVTIAFRFPHRTTFLVKQNVGQKLNKGHQTFWQLVAGGWLFFLLINRTSFKPKLAAPKV